MNLTQKLESIMEPSRALDIEIVKSIGYKRVAEEWNSDGKKEWYAWVSDQRMGPWIVIPHYTSDVKAALTLIPEGWFTFLAMEDRHSGSWFWELRNAGRTVSSRNVDMAMAICGAALLAREFKPLDNIGVPFV